MILDALRAVWERRPALFKAKGEHDVYEAIARQRRLLMAGEDKAVRRMLGAYAVALKGIEGKLAAVEKMIAQAQAAGDPVSPAWLYQQARWKTLAATIEKEIGQFAAQAAQTVTAQQASSATAGTKSASELAALSGVTSGFIALPKEALADMVGALTDESPVVDLFKAMGGDAVSFARETFAAGVAAGENPRKIAQTLRKGIKGLSSDRAVLIARTESIRAYTTAQQRNYEANSDVVLGSRISSARDGRTCPLCWARDGTVIPHGQPFARHPGCRCALAPVTKYLDTSRGTGEEAFAKLPEATRRKILGPSRHALHQAGTITLLDLVEETDHPRWGRGVRGRNLKELDALVKAGKAKAQGMVKLPGGGTLPDDPATVLPLKTVATAVPAQAGPDPAKYPPSAKAGPANYLESLIKKAVKEGLTVEQVAALSNHHFPGSPKSVNQVSQYFATKGLTPPGGFPPGFVPKTVASAPKAATAPVPLGTPAPAPSGVPVPPKATLPAPAPPSTAPAPLPVPKLKGKPKPVPPAVPATSLVPAATAPPAPAAQPKVKKAQALPDPQPLINGKLPADAPDYLLQLAVLHPDATVGQLKKKMDQHFPGNGVGVKKIEEELGWAAGATIGAKQYFAPPGHVFTTLAAPAPVVPAATKSQLKAAEILAKAGQGQKGSNDGGFFVGADGVERYVKWYADPAQAHGEALANDIYRELGLGAPESRTFVDDHSKEAGRKGKTAFASDVLAIEGTVGTKGLTKDTAYAILDGFAADILTGNWDAVGTGLDNVVVLKGGGIARIDQGGTFLFRAKAGRKAKAYLDDITEWEGFAPGGINPDYARVFDAAGVADADALAVRLRGQVDGIKALRDRSGGWDAFVAARAPALSPTDRTAVAGMLKARTDLLDARVTAALKPKPKPKKVPAGGVDRTTLNPRTLSQPEGLKVRSKLYSKVWKSFTVDEKKAIQTYKSHYYQPLNKHLRGLGPPPGQWLMDIVPHLESAFRKVEAAGGAFAEDLLIYRGVGLKIWHDLKPGVNEGDILKDHSFISTANDRDVSERFAASSLSGDPAHPVLLKITMPRGTVALPAREPAAGDGEHEFILDHANYRVTKIEKVPWPGGRTMTILSVELIESKDGTGAFRRKIK